MSKMQNQSPKSDSDELLLGFPGLFFDKSEILICAECDFTFTFKKDVSVEDEEEEWEGVCPHCGSSYLV